MKYIKLFDNYNDIETICDQYDIRYYTINNGLVDVDGAVGLTDLKLEKLPLKFGKVNGNFICSYNKLTTLKGCPEYVGSMFDCRSNRLKSLIDGPKYVGSMYCCNTNKLNTLEGSPKYAGGSFEFKGNKIKTLKYFPEVKYDISMGNNLLPKEIYDNEKYIKDIVKLQYEYGIWNYNDTLNISRFNLMMEEIKN